MLENKNTPNMDRIKNIRNINKDTLSNAGRENIAVSISFLSSGNYLISLNSLVTLSTLKILIIWGADLRKLDDVPTKDIIMSRTEVHVTKKSN